MPSEPNVEEEAKLTPDSVKNTGSGKDDEQKSGYIVKLILKMK